MPKLQIPLDILGVVGGGVESSNPAGKKTVTVLVQTGGGEMALRLTSEVAEALYHTVFEEVRDK